MDLLGFISQALNLSGRVGAVIASTAGAVLGLNRLGVPPLSQIPVDTLTNIAVVGVFGGCLLVVDLAYFGVPKLWALRSVARAATKASKAERENGLNNLPLMVDEFSCTMQYLYSNKLFRFPASPDNDVLRNMCKSNLLKIDDPNYNYHSTLTYYAVPEYIIEALDRSPNFFGTRRPPTLPPWSDETDRSTSWMRF